MKFISVIALLAPAVLAAPGDAWITLIKEQCPDMSEQCLNLAKEAHQPGFDMVAAVKAKQTLPTCNPAYETCIQNLSGGGPETFPLGATQADPATCVLQIAPDHIKYFLDNDKASTPIPASRNCALRELHRVAHVELGPLA